MGPIAADNALESGKETVFAYLTSSEGEAKAKKAEEELLLMLDAEEGALKKKKKQEKQKQSNTERVEGSGEENPL